MKKILTIMMVSLLLSAPAFATKAKIVAGTSFGFTGATGVDTAIFSYYFEGSTTALVVDTLATGWTAPAFISDSISTDSTGRWMVFIKLIDSSGTTWSDAVERKTFIEPYARWGEYVFDASRVGALSNGGFDMDTTSAGEPMHWDVTLAGDAVAGDYFVRTPVDDFQAGTNKFDSKNELYVVGGSNDTLRFTSNAFYAPRNAMIRYGIRANDYATLNGRFVIELQVAGGATLDSLLVDGSFIGNASVNAEKSFAVATAQFMEFQLSVYGTTADPVNWQFDDAFVEIFAMDSMRVVALVDSARTVGAFGDTINILLDDSALIADLRDTLINHNDTFKTDISGISGGSGANLIQTYLLDGADSSAILGGLVDLKNTSDSSTSISHDQTDANGLASNNVNDGSYYQMATAFQYSFTNRTLSVSGANVTDTMFGTKFNPGSPATSFTATVYGNLSDITGGVAQFLDLTFTMAADVDDTCTNKFTIQRSWSVRTDATGAFTVPLIWSNCFETQDYIMTIGHPAMKSRSFLINVPDSTSYLLTPSNVTLR